MIRMVLWCVSCDDWCEEPHDCPYRAGVRVMPKYQKPEIEEPVMPKKPQSVPLWLAFLIIAGSGLGTALIVRFAAWLGGR